MSLKSITVCSVCKQRVYGIMGRSMNILYYDGYHQPMKKHADPPTGKHLDKKGKPIPWVAETKMVENEP